MHYAQNSIETLKHEEHTTAQMIVWTNDDSLNTKHVVIVNHVPVKLTLRIDDNSIMLGVDQLLNGNGSAILRTSCDMREHSVT